MVIEKKDIDACIIDLLDSVRLRSTSKGRGLLLSAIRKYYINPIKYKRNIYKDLYNELAEETGSTFACVEKNIRKALERAWQIGNPDLQYQLYGSIIDGDKPTAASFIIKSAEIIKSRLR